MNNATLVWSPSSNALHRFIQLSDVFYIAADRFQCLLMHYRGVEYDTAGDQLHLVLREEQCSEAFRPIWADLWFLHNTLVEPFGETVEDAASLLADESLAYCGETMDKWLRDLEQWYCHAWHIFSSACTRDVTRLDARLDFHKSRLELVLGYKTLRRGVFSAMAEGGLAVQRSIRSYIYAAVSCGTAWPARSDAGGIG